jgi:hypothetical protein
METNGNQKLLKSCFFLNCKSCDYSTSKKSSYEKHLSTAKHLKTLKKTEMETNGNQKLLKSCSDFFTCEICSKEFKNRSGLWKHNKKCNLNDLTNTNMVSSTSDKDIVMILIKENAELKNMMIDQQNMMMKVLENGTHNTTNNINSHNKSFNLNFFLNETCKDAMNINEFIDSIKLQLSDLERVGELGYVEGISNIIVKNLKQLDITQRPVHCTDKKRETIYIKDDDKWEKDEEKDKMHKIVRKVANKNARMLPKFKEAHPDCNKAVSKYSDAYNKIIVESMGGSGDNNFEKEEKIIKRVAKEIILEKES